MEPRPDAIVRYERQGEFFHITLHVNEPELRQVLIGLWKRLSPSSQADFIHELQHYQQPTSRLSPLAHMVAAGEEMASVFDVNTRFQQEFLDDELEPHR